jgi:hypothetical protein
MIKECKLKENKILSTCAADQVVNAPNFDTVLVLVNLSADNSDVGYPNRI